jgi:diguanylate cyclase (GGDEF)-like protein
MQPQEVTRTEELRKEIQGLDSKDIQLWSIGVLIIMALAAGFAALLVPNVLWNLGLLNVSSHFLPQLFFGFIVLIVLFNIYTLQRRRSFQRTRDDLVHELVRREAAEKLSLIDPLTELYNWRYLSQVLPREVNRADRLETHLTFLMLDVEGFKTANTKFGHVRGDHILSEVAQVLKRTFRTSDTVIRYGGDEFLVLLTETDEKEAERAVERLLESVSRWNRENGGEGFTLKFVCGFATYTKGANANEVIQVAEQKMDVGRSGHSVGGGVNGGR